MCLVRNLYLWTFQIQLCGNIKCIYVQKCKMLRYLRVCQNFTLCNQRLIGDNDMLLAEWSSKKILRNVFKVYNIIRHHRYSSTSPFLMIVAQNFHLQWQTSQELRMLSRSLSDCSTLLYSALNLNRSHCSHCGQCLLVSTSVY